MDLLWTLMKGRQMFLWMPTVKMFLTCLDFIGAATFLDLTDPIFKKILDLHGSSCSSDITLANFYLERHLLMSHLKTANKFRDIGQVRSSMGPQSVLNGSSMESQQGTRVSSARMLVRSRLVMSGRVERGLTLKQTVALLSPKWGRRGDPHRSVRCCD